MKKACNVRDLQKGVRGSAHFQLSHTGELRRVGDEDNVTAWQGHRCGFSAA